MENNVLITNADILYVNLFKLYIMNSKLFAFKNLVSLRHGFGFREIMKIGRETK